MLTITQLPSLWHSSDPMGKGRSTTARRKQRFIQPLQIVRDSTHNRPHNVQRRMLTANRGRWRNSSASPSEGERRFVTVVAKKITNPATPGPRHASGKRLGRERSGAGSGNLFSATINHRKRQWIVNLAFHLSARIFVSQYKCSVFWRYDQREG